MLGLGRVARFDWLSRTSMRITEFVWHRFRNLLVADSAYDQSTAKCLFADLDCCAED